MTPAAARENGNDSVIAKLEKEEFSVLDSSGKELQIKEVSSSPAESVLVGYSENAGPTYIRTVSFFTGAPEKPLFEENDKSTVPELDDPENEKVQEEFIPINEVPEVDPEELQLGTVIAVNTNSAALAWTMPKEATSASVLIDGKETKSSAHGVEINGLEPGTSHEITVTFNSVAGKDVGLVREDTHMIQTLKPETSNPLENVEAANVVAAAASMQKARAVRFVTFLKDDFYPSGWMGTGGCFTNPTWHFKGDNRGYSSPAPASLIDTHPSYRTGLEVIAELHPAAAQGVYTSKKVGLTKRYDANKNFVDSKRAANTGIVVQNPTKSASNYLKFGVSHEIGDPYCWIGKIRYSIPTVQIFQSGTISISGSRQPIPTFEFYGSFVRSNGSGHWITLYRGAESGLGCLLGTCVSQNISKTASTT